MYVIILSSFCSNLRRSWFPEGFEGGLCIYSSNVNSIFSTFSPNYLLLYDCSINPSFILLSSEFVAPWRYFTIVFPLRSCFLSITFWEVGGGNHLQTTFILEQKGETGSRLCNFRYKVYSTLMNYHPFIIPYRCECTRTNTRKQQ